NIQASIIGGAK
nr:juvenile hormone binding protein, JHBP=12.5kda CNBr peptide [Manduca sexta, Peptide Partial, 11 aa] [Manduca sexta]